MIHRVIGAAEVVDRSDGIREIHIIRLAENHVDIPNSGHLGMTVPIEDDIIIAGSPSI